METVVSSETRQSELDNSYSATMAKVKMPQEDDEISSGTDSPVSCSQDSNENRCIKEEEDDDSDQEIVTETKGKPTLSYIALISMAILSTPGQRMLLSEIYSWIAKNFPYYKHKDRSWRNSIRHNLSLNECFIKAGRSENGKGNYWTIHPANAIDFGQGDFRRRRARRRVRQCNEELERLRTGLLGLPDASSSNKNPQDLPSSGDFYVPMTSTWAPKSVLTAIFGPEIVLSPEEKNCMKRKRFHHRSVANNVICEPAQNVSGIQGGLSSCDFQSSCGLEPQACNAVVSQEEAQLMGLLPQAAQLQQMHSAMGTWPLYGMHSAPQYGTMPSHHYQE